MAHAHVHSHGTGEGFEPAPRPVRLVLALVIGGLIIATALALVTLWPRATPDALTAPRSAAVSYLDATVSGVESVACGPASCEAVRARIESGPLIDTEVQLTNLTSTSLTPVLQVGDRIVVAQEITLMSADPGYSFVDYQRRAPMALLAGLFAIVVVGIARWRGIAAIVGLAFTWWVLVAFLLPAILAGESPIAVALTASALILIVVLYLAHGFNARTSTALIGTLVSLMLTGLLGWYFTSAARLTGVTSDEATYLANTVSGIDLSGLLLCGIIIGSLGVLNDVTVTQAASVWEVHAADPSQSVRRLYRAGMRIGRDHIASTVYTLVLAYAGASLPLLILFIIGNRQFGDVVTGEIVAEEVVRTLVGSIGLVASVPVTTYLAALVVSQGRPSSAPSPADDRTAVAIGADAPPGRTGAAPTIEHQPEPEPADGGARSPDRDDHDHAEPLAPSPPTLRARAADRRRQRRAERAVRAAAKQRSWQAPAAEREFWED